MNESEFNKQERKTCPLSDQCNVSCTTCNIDSSVVQKWREMGE